MGPEKCLKKKTHKQTSVLVVQIRSPRAVLPIIRPQTKPNNDKKNKKKHFRKKNKKHQKTMGKPWKKTCGSFPVLFNFYETKSYPVPSRLGQPDPRFSRLHSKVKQESIAIYSVLCLTMSSVSCCFRASGGMGVLNDLVSNKKGQ